MNAANLEKSDSCSIKGCIKKAKQNGMCSMHDTRNYRNGSPHIVLKHMHGLSKKSSHNSWENMLDRCRNPKNKRFHRYGGRGIKVCDRWLKFENFYSDMGDKPKGLTLGRINNDGDYAPNNCRWETQRQQMSNTKRNVYLIFDNKKLSVSEWARRKRMKVDTLYRRLFFYGWPIEEALTKPVRPIKCRRNKAA